MATAEWWLCPNEPRCPHGGVLHDVVDPEDQIPRCCVTGCECGRDLPSDAQVVTFGAAR